MLGKTLSMLAGCSCTCDKWIPHDNGDDDGPSNTKALLNDDPHIPSVESDETAEVNFTIERQQGQALGLDLDIEDGKTAHVCHVLPGPIMFYNTTVQPNLRLERFDYIVGVNGISGNAKKILNQISSGTKLEFNVKRPHFFTVTINREDNVELGLDLDYAPNGMSLLIRRVKNGKIQEWNSTNADQAVQVADRIVEVNGKAAGETVAPLLKQLKQKAILDIVIARPAPPPRSKDRAQEHKESMAAAMAGVPAIRGLAREEGEDEAEEEAQNRAEEEAQQLAEDEARQRAEEEARRRAEEESRQRGAEEAQRRAEEEAQRRAEEEAQRRAEDEARQRAEEEQLQRRHDEDEEASQSRAGEESAEVDDEDGNVTSLAEVACVSKDQATAALVQTGGNLDEALVLLMSMKDET